ncbi:Spore coat protein CotF-like [Moorella glycerini]|uniref:Coat F domain protein n=1 Tax=Neomoorella stamsii TaxID=1266720 RepID=A0A9X7P775_9FIRM|nr:MULTISPECIES: spore coat protein [Moorella]PRR75623.1 Coat F domain protein [Moorella stamsii]CEP66479.1 Spore coat protein CotF-like [Moorella glycerini]
MPIQRFDDKTMCSDCLASEKLLTSCYNTAITECASDQLRRDFMTVYQDEQNCLKAVWDVMHSKGWYQLNMASQQEISQLQQLLQQEQMQLQQGGMMGAQMGMAPQVGGGIPQYRV